jgi:solute:Na+ symporter, SSS family
MISFNFIDLIIISLFFITVLLIGIISGKKAKNDPEGYLLDGRNVGLFVFVLTNVSTWYGGILGIGEFSYRYGLESWFTQGLPYYIFAFLFALFFAKKVRAAGLFTIPDKLNQVYGKKVALISAFIVFVLVSPAPYLLMTANLLLLIFKTNTLVSLILALLLSLVYLFKGGYRSDLYANVFQFFVMFAGFIIIVVISYLSFGGYNYLEMNLPVNHLKITGGASPVYLIVWFLIALWTFADPGFHQRSYAARSGSIAVKGIIISIIFFALFDFLTTTTGLYARAYLPDLSQPVLSFPLYAEKILSPGLKGFFYAALFATIMSTLNSFLFLSGTTIGRDFIFRLFPHSEERRLKSYTITGLIISGIISVILAYFIPSVIEIWYLIGSVCIPAIIIVVISAYYPKIKISSGFIIVEMIIAVGTSISWYFLRIYFRSIPVINVIEPMIIGLIFALIIHCAGMLYGSGTIELKRTESKIPD